jgi:hypothetical protein
VVTSVLADAAALVPAEAEAGADVQPVPEAGPNRVHSDNVQCADAYRPLVSVDHQHVLILGLGHGSVEALTVGQFHRLTGSADDFPDVLPLDINRTHVVRAELEQSAVHAFHLAGNAVAVFQVHDVGFFRPGSAAVQQQQEQAMHPQDEHEGARMAGNAGCEHDEPRQIEVGQ